MAPHGVAVGTADRGRRRKYPPSGKAKGRKQCKAVKWIYYPKERHPCSAALQPGLFLGSGAGQLGLAKGKDGVDGRNTRSDAGTRGQVAGYRDCGAVARGPLQLRDCASGQPMARNADPPQWRSRLLAEKIREWNGIISALRPLSLRSLFSRPAAGRP
jgi:hypothetical protein